MIPVILSGGSGTRLWPLSRSKTPKQFCHFFEQSLQEMTLRRLMPLGAPWIVTNQGLKDQCNLQLRNLGLPLEHLVLEPTGRNTAPAIALICHILKAQGAADEVIGIFPADHLIEDEKAFAAALKLAEAEARVGKIVTLGLQPHFPATGYGYIQVSARAEIESPRAVPVVRFHEKPDLKTAESFLRKGTYYWNAGIFIFSLGHMVRLLELHQPELWREISQVKSDLSNLAEVYDKIKGNSIDYAILEKLGSSDLSCVPCDVGWSDIGSWDAIAEILEDRKTDSVQVQGSGNFVHALPQKVYTFGDVSDLIVVDTKDALLVTRKGQSQVVKEIVDHLKDRQSDLLRQHLDEERPWGGFEVLKDTEKFKSKVVMVNPGQQLSYQSHDKREEHWLVIEGEGEVVLDGKIIPVRAGSYIKIPLSAKHRIRNTGKNLMQFVEVQLGSYFGEDDITRYQDDYLRE